MVDITFGLVHFIVAKTLKNSKFYVFLHKLWTLDWRTRFSLRDKPHVSIVFVSEKGKIIDPAKTDLENCSSHIIEPQACQIKGVYIPYETKEGLKVHKAIGVRKIGGSTFTLHLPPEWQESDEYQACRIHDELTNQRLIILAPPKQEENKT